MNIVQPVKLSDSEMAFLESKIRLFLDFLKDEVFSKFPEGKWDKLEKFTQNDPNFSEMKKETRDYVTQIIEMPPQLFDDQFSFTETNQKVILLGICLLSFGIDNKQFAETLIEQYMEKLVDHKIEKKIINNKEFLICIEAEVERREQDKNRRKRSVAGKKGADALWNKKKGE